MSFQTDCLYSTVKNISGVAKTFSFLPPHGKKLEVDEEMTVYGDIREAVIRGERNGSQRCINALLQAVAGDTPSLEIVSTPSPVLWDETDAVSKVLTVDNDTLAFEEVCWHTSEV